VVRSIGRRAGLNDQVSVQKFVAAPSGSLTTEIETGAAAVDLPCADARPRQVGGTPVNERHCVRAPTGQTVSARAREPQCLLETTEPSEDCLFHRKRVDAIE
jgi:hypothetical protein